MSMSLSSTFQPSSRNSLMISNFSAEMAWFSPVSFWDFVICVRRAARVKGSR